MAYKVILLSLCVALINAGEGPLNVPVNSNQQASFQITVSAVPSTSHQAPVIKYTSTPTFVQHQEPILQYAARYSPFPFPFAPQQIQFTTAHIDPVPKLGETGQIPHLLRLQFSEAPGQYGNLVQNPIPFSLAPQTIQFRAVPLQYASSPVQIATKVSQEQYAPPPSSPSVQYGPAAVQIGTKVDSQEEYPLPPIIQYNTAPVQIANKVVTQKQYGPPPAQYLPAPPPAQYLPAPPRAQYLPAPPQVQHLPAPPPPQYLPAPPQPQYLPAPPSVQYLPAPVQTATKVASEGQYDPPTIQYNPLPVQIQKVAKVVTQEQYGAPPPPHHPIQYASTPSPIQFASTPAPIQYASTPSPIQFASTPSPIQYASTPAPVQYASTPSPIQYASTPAPVQYASTPAPIQYSSSPTPIQYGSTHSPNFQYSSGPQFILKKIQPTETPFQIVVNDDQVQYAENSSPIEPEPQLQEVRQVVPAPKLVKLIKKDYDHNPDYVYGYNIQDTQTGDDKSQSEQRQGNFVRGSYSVVDPDGHRRTVDYTADPVHGFSAVVRREPVHAKVLAPVSKIAVPVSKVSITGAYAS